MNRSDALLFLARCLAPDDPQSDLATEIAAGRVHWERVVEIASEYWMTLALYRELDEKGLLPLLPDDLVEYFQVMREANRTRNLGILEHVGELARLLNGIGVEPVLVKGVAHLISGLYPDPAMRIMADIDIVIPEDRAPECWRLLRASGYATPPSASGEYLPRPDLPALTRKGFTGEVEMHHPAEWESMTGSPELYLDLEPVTLGGGKARILSATGRIIFALAHSYVQHAAEVRTHPPLRDLYDANLLMWQFDRQIAWPQVIDAFDRGGQSEALRTACMMWRRLLPPGPAIEIAEPFWTGIYWQCCMHEIPVPAWELILQRVAKNARLLCRAFSSTPEGKQVRRAIVTPSVLYRKLRNAALLSIGASEGKWK